MAFVFENVNEQQKEAITTTEGPVLITAGPGTGKTFTLVQRAIYLVQECNVAPEQIFIATFTEKAAKELITRITNELAAKDISVNVNDMYIGTFHSICLRIIKDYLEYSVLKKNYRMLDSFDQEYMVYQNLYSFKNITGIDELIKTKGWRMAEEICTYVNNLSEEMVDENKMCKDKNSSISALGHILKKYRELLIDGNLIDFSTIQTECYRILTENPEILSKLQDKIKYVMVDEYQDTNYIQEQFVFLLAKFNMIDTTEMDKVEQCVVLCKMLSDKSDEVYGPHDFDEYSIDYHALSDEDEEVEEADKNLPVKVDMKPDDVIVLESLDDDPALARRYKEFMCDLFGDDREVPEKMDQIFREQVATLGDEKCKDVIWGIYREGKKGAQIARELGVSNSYIYHLRMRGLRLLRHPTRSRFFHNGYVVSM